MLRLCRHYSTNTDTNPKNDPITLTAHSIGVKQRPLDTTYEPYYASLGGRQWLSFNDNYLDYRFIQLSMTNSTLMDCISFVLKKTITDKRDASTIGIYDLTLKKSYTDVHTKHVVIVRFTNCWQPVGYVNPNDPLHRVQMTFPVNGLPEICK
jgi:hypothetical protein